MTRIIIATAIETDIIQIQSCEEDFELDSFELSFIVSSFSLATFKLQSLINVLTLLPAKIWFGSPVLLIPSILTNRKFLNLLEFVSTSKQLLIASFISRYWSAKLHSLVL